MVSSWLKSDVMARGSEERRPFINIFSDFVMRSLLFVIGLIAVCTQLQAQTNIVLHPGQAKETINRNIYGHFAEHLGRCIYDGIYVGDTSPIPNTAGVRNDIIEALRKLKVPNLRWPGGCFA